MALSLTVSCSCHQKSDGVYGKEVEISIDSIDERAQQKVKRELEGAGWVVQFNGENMDTYCSKTCAK